MTTDAESTGTKLLYGDLSYKLNGVLYSVHNELGRFEKEKHYANSAESKLKDSDILYKRECIVGESGSIADFIIEDAIILELKAKPFLLETDYEQVQRYLQVCNLRLGILVNFRSRYLQPKRVLRRDYL